MLLIVEIKTNDVAAKVELLPSFQFTGKTVKIPNSLIITGKSVKIIKP
jgi:hypothetical protein